MRAADENFCRGGLGAILRPVRATPTSMFPGRTCRRRARSDPIYQVPSASMASFGGFEESANFVMILFPRRGFDTATDVYSVGLGRLHTFSRVARCQAS